MKHYQKNPYQPSRLYYVNELKKTKSNLNYKANYNLIDQTIDKWLFRYFKMVAPFFEHDENVINSYDNNDIDLEFDNSSVNKLPKWLIKVINFIEMIFNKVFNLVKDIKLKSILTHCYKVIYRFSTKAFVKIKSLRPKAPPK